VSHGLITHYFGTYAGLIEAVLERRIQLLRETMLARLREAGALARPTELLATLFRALSDPVHLRLTRWMLASERPSAVETFALRDRGLQQIAQQIATAIEAKPGREVTEKIELALLVGVASAYGYAIGKYALAAALGRQVSTELDGEVQRTLAAMLEGYLRGELGTRPQP
jgi:AcrR family transcriptional regulator